jgi:hypothetical protein
MRKSYNPRADQEKILTRAFELIQSVLYQVSARWLFYGLLQEGTYPDKDSYHTKFLPLISKARKSFFKNWRPDILNDDTREPIIRGNGHWNEKSWLKAVGKAECELDKWQYQDRYVEIWFEAKAMKGQFEYYTKHITLRPFGGDPSIKYKWDIAKELEQAAESYELPITILYFGDLDPKGLMIPESAIKDIREWCRVDFEFIRAGLNPGDEVKYNIMENPERPGTFQWEALSDEAAKKIINGAVEQFVNQGYSSEVEQMEKDITRKFQTTWESLVESKF